MSSCPAGSQGGTWCLGTAEQLNLSCGQTGGSPCRAHKSFWKVLISSWFAPPFRLFTFFLVQIKLPNNHMLLWMWKIILVCEILTCMYFDSLVPRQQISSTSKNISKAKQLVEKAKAIRHNRSKVNEEAPAPVRRSSRQRALAEKKKLQEDEVKLYTL